ncbi:hypothetical protein QCA50_006584 [Cerrena zonata]|uniref:NAD(P)-binding protein n=1 Tax=Cerrena zonata TaxID=2478898 RepID=A0AAW0GF94_9APHY
MVADTVESLGCLDIMVANAGIVGGGTLDTLPVETFDKVIAVNLRGTMMCYKYAGQEMVKQGRGGRIIGASSVVGKKGSGGLTAYSATKFAIRGLTQSFAMEMLSHRVTVNAYCPGLIITEMTASPSDVHFGGRHGAAVRQSLGVPPEIPDGKPEDIASWVSYICKPEAHYITGSSSLIASGAVMD